MLNELPKSTLTVQNRVNRELSPTESCEEDILYLLKYVDFVITQLVVFCAPCGAFR